MAKAYKFILFGAGITAILFMSIAFLKPQKQMEVIEDDSVDIPLVDELGHPPPEDSFPEFLSIAKLEGEAVESAENGVELKKHHHHHDTDKKHEHHDEKYHKEHQKKEVAPTESDASIEKKAPEVEGNEKWGEEKEKEKGEIKENETTLEKAVRQAVDEIRKGKKAEEEADKAQNVPQEEEKEKEKPLSKEEKKKIKHEKKKMKKKAKKAAKHNGEEKLEELDKEELDDEEESEIEEEINNAGLVEEVEGEKETQDIQATTIEQPKREAQIAEEMQILVVDEQKIEAEPHLKFEEKGIDTIPTDQILDRTKDYQILKEEEQSTDPHSVQPQSMKDITSGGIKVLALLIATLILTAIVFIGFEYYGKDLQVKEQAIAPVSPPREKMNNDYVLLTALEQLNTEEEDTPSIRDF